MNLLDTTGKTIASAIVEYKKPICGFMFTFNGKLTDLTTETVLIKVVRTDTSKNVSIHKEAVLLADYIYLATYLGNPIGSDSRDSVQVRVPLTLKGNIVPTDSDFISFEFKNLKTTKSYVFNSLEASFNATTAMTYTKLTQPKDNSSIDFLVNGYDSAVLTVTSDITAVTTRYLNGYQKIQTIAEFRAEIEQANGVAYIDYLGVVYQSLGSKLLIPLYGVSMMTFTKDAPTAVTTMLCRNNLIN